MGKCALCNKRVQRGTGPFFRVPNDERTRLMWSKHGRVTLRCKDYICIDHFSSSDIIKAGRPRLLPKAVPHPLPPYTSTTGSRTAVQPNFVDSAHQIKVFDIRTEETNDVNYSQQKLVQQRDRIPPVKNKQSKEDWKSWCRLCAKAEAQYINALSGQCLPNIPVVNIHPILNIAAIIKKFFHVDINQNDHLSTLVCTECYQVINSLVEFHENIKKVQKLYDDLLHNKGKSKIDLRSLYTKFGIFKEAESLTANRSNDLTVEGVFVSDKYIASKAFKVENQVNNEETNINVYPEVLIEDIGNKDQFQDPIGEEKMHTDSSFNEEYHLYSSLSEDSLDEDEQHLQNIINVENIGNEGFQEHIKESNYTCEICLHPFRRSGRYAAHMLKNHNQIICTDCFDTFENEDYLKLHIKEQHQLHPCNKCNKKFQKKEYLLRHMRRVHDDEQSFFCEVCLAAFRLRTELEEHLLLHTDYLPHECNECGKSFQHRKNLKRHMLTHGDKYICTVCGKQLNSPRTYKNHMLVHYDKTYHKCDYCGREFKRSKALKTHLILHSGLKLYSCEFCERTFSCRSYCRMHMKLKHPYELAALEASGEKAYTTVPRLDELKSFVRSAENLQPVNLRRGGKLKSKPEDTEQFEIETLEEETLDGP